MAFTPRDVISWSGTRDLNDDGRAWIRQFLSNVPPKTLIVTGGCIGVDAYAAQIAKHMFLLPVHTLVPDQKGLVDPNWWDNCTSYELMPSGTTYRDRNIRLVTRGTRLVAVADYPERNYTSKRSGTWQTIRIARNQIERPVVIFTQHQDGGIA